MAEDEGPRNADFEQASTSLDEGLKTCRAVLRSYRELLTSDRLFATPIADNDDQPALPLSD